jgi:hypothetical protein
MTHSEIDYPALVDEALRSVARRVLERVADQGLPGDHHFFITFDTNHPDLQIPPSLRDTHPAEMTIVLQNQFWDLVVEEDGFAVSLRFSGKPHRLRIPWQALRSFVDPEAEFGLRFESEEASGEDGETPEDEAPTPSRPEVPAEVVSLDEFRRRDG